MTSVLLEEFPQEIVDEIPGLELLSIVVITFVFL
jgi:hypothetical protein